MFDGNLSCNDVNARFRSSACSSRGSCRFANQMHAPRRAQQTFRLAHTEWRYATRSASIALCKQFVCWGHWEYQMLSLSPSLSLIAIDCRKHSISLLLTMVRAATATALTHKVIKKISVLFAHFSANFQLFYSLTTWLGLLNRRMDFVQRTECFKCAHNAAALVGVFSPLFSSLLFSSLFFLFIPFWCSIKRNSHLQCESIGNGNGNLVCRCQRPRDGERLSEYL